MGSTVRLRSRAAQALGVAMTTLSAAGLLTTAVDGGVLQYGAPMLLFGLLGWAAFWQPYVEVSDGAVRIANTLRTVEVPWPAIESVDGRYGLRLDTAFGQVSAWAAPAPAGRQRARGELGSTAAVVAERLESLRAAGHLENPRLERSSMPTTWHWPLIVAAVLLAVASVALPALG